MNVRTPRLAVVLPLVLLPVIAACGSRARVVVEDDAAVEGASPTLAFDEAGAPPDASLGRDPETCEEATLTRSYVGCDYYPTVTANNVWSVFDYAVVVSNIGKTAAEVRVEGPSATNVVAVLAPGELRKIYLPWVPALKGPDADAFGSAVAMTASVVARKGAFHLVSSVPVVVYQFNALEYRGQGGPPGKSWASCPNRLSCFSRSNDASLLLPTTAWTTSYRVTGMPGWSTGAPLPDPHIMGATLSVTAAFDDTDVTVHLAGKAHVLAGADTPAKGPGETVTFRLQKGDVAELVTPKGERYDLSGSLVASSHPVEVITGIPCVNVPKDQAACDHVEETVLPAEALGRRYVVTTPSRPKGGRGLHVVRLYGNRDGTRLVYAPKKPAGCPDTLGAGEVAECSGLVSEDFVVEATAEIGVSSFLVGATMYDPTDEDPRGDPSQTSFAAIEQFRRTYLFLAPDDYDTSYAVVVGPEDARPVLDGVPVSAPFEPIAAGLGTFRVTLGPGKGGSHTLVADKPVGVQVLGYGGYTSYAYPGGLDLRLISPPPALPK
ncbi:MAG: IgGFc-binding protein [Polyangiaceae bacterium]